LCIHQAHSSAFQIELFIYQQTCVIELGQKKPSSAKKKQKKQAKTEKKNDSCRCFRYGLDQKKCDRYSTTGKTSLDQFIEYSHPSAAD
jgi:hypothetical protein